MLLLYWIWFPIIAASKGGFQTRNGVFRHFYNGINEGSEKQASDAYCWIASLFRSKSIRSSHSTNFSDYELASTEPLFEILDLDVEAIRELKVVNWRIILFETTPHSYQSIR